MSLNGAEVIVAGHICLDIIPHIPDRKAGMDALLVPGKLVDIGQAIVSTGGAVSNTGIALHRLGNNAKLMGKVGNDLFGKAIIEVLEGYSKALAEGMIIADGEASSYSIVISPPGVDRIFLHCTGTNDTYSVQDIPFEQLDGAKLFHFGYPPLMRCMYENEGKGLADLLRQAKERGVTVSLDLAKPDPESPAGQADWTTILAGALPYVDVFLPSFEEILYMLYPDIYDSFVEKTGSNDLLHLADGPILSKISDDLLAMGAAVVGLKLGEHGLYVRTTSNPARLATMGRCAPDKANLERWLDRELLSTCYKVKVAGTTGAGDCTIAGFLAALLRGVALEEALQSAVGVGAFNVEKSDATSGVPTWDEVQARVKQGWDKRELLLDLVDWKPTEDGLWTAPTR
ncbi:carbohydrate kinase family protein [Cohnella abietis]|uniref:PfkB family kinase n=1 Tax=Cohnella abietis TaxID=2507935 RepID=A0A3T1D466_9BACL|nr:carbohydrate kinase family protein [Cohnella abietis]BBI32897.1 PfkB family kinase [Cohnella abietis]